MLRFLLVTRYIGNSYDNMLMKIKPFIFLKELSMVQIQKNEVLLLF